MSLNRSALNEQALNEQAQSTIKVSRVVKLPFDINAGQSVSLPLVSVINHRVRALISASNQVNKVIQCPVSALSKVKKVIQCPISSDEKTRLNRVVHVRFDLLSESGETTINLPVLESVLEPVLNDSGEIINYKTVQEIVGYSQVLVSQPAPLVIDARVDYA